MRTTPHPTSKNLVGVRDTEWGFRNVHTTHGEQGDAFCIPPIGQHHIEVVPVGVLFRVEIEHH